jgi:hypothetical protein
MSGQESAPMDDQKLNQLNTVTVTAARLVGREGATALALVTKEAGTIAFEIDLHAIEIIRKTLDLAENLLRAQSGNSPDRPS